MKKSIYLLAFIVFCNILSGQVYTSSIAGSISDDGTSITEFPIEIKDLSPDQIDSSFGLIKICINLNHPSMDQLELWLTSPGGQKVLLTTGLGGSDFQGCLDMKSNNFIANNWGPYTDTYRPIRNFGHLNSKVSGNGIWRLLIKDRYPGQSGILNSWSLSFGMTPPKPSKPYLQSKLPIIRINTSAKNILDDPKRIVDFELIDNPLQGYNGFHDSAILKAKIGIELRGSSSQWFPKKSYGFEFVDSLGIETKIGLLGMPEESDWILSANFTDKSFMNNVLAYDLYRDLGRYASRVRYVDLVINDEHQGLYVLMEKIKQDKNRVDISKLTLEDTSGVQLTGGYIFKIDKGTGGNGAGWTSNFPPNIHPFNQIIYYQYHYPTDDKMNDQQKKYITHFVDTFEQTLYYDTLIQKDKGWRQYADEASFIHYFLLNELSRNTDGYRLSTYLYKTRDDKGGKLTIGPPWDYDIAFGNINYCAGEQTSGWAIDFGNVCPGDNWQLPFWWDKLLSDSLFINNLQCEYSKLRATSWSNKSLENRINNYELEIQDAAEKNFDLWSILGLYIWPNPYPFPPTFHNNVTTLKRWLIKRLEWMDANMPGLCILTNINDKNNKIIEENYTINPNPSHDEINIKISNVKSSAKKINIYNMQGILAASVNVYGGDNFYISSKNLPSGIYLSKIICENGSSIQKTFSILH